MTTHEGALRVATATGVVQVTGDAKVTTLAPGAPLRVDGALTLYADRVESSSGSRPQAGAVDILDRGDGALLLYADRLEWWPKDGPQEVLATGLTDTRALANVANGHVVLACADRLYDTADTKAPLVSGLVDTRGIAADDRGRLYVVHGAPPQLYRVDGGALTLVARHLGDVRDLSFGTGGLLPRENLYLLRAEGQIDYLRPP